MIRAPRPIAMPIVALTFIFLLISFPVGFFAPRWGPALAAAFAATIAAIFFSSARR